MRGRRSTLRIQMDDPTRTTLQSWLHRQKTPSGLARRAMLLLEQGQTYLHTAERVGLAECQSANGLDASMSMGYLAYRRSLDLAVSQFFRPKSPSTLSKSLAKDLTR